MIMIHMICPFCEKKGEVEDFLLINCDEEGDVVNEFRCPDCGTEVECRTEVERGTF